MIHAILTIDDIASANTPAIVDYLNDKGITALMFAVGENVERYYDNAIYALQHGMIVGNHSYSHPAFSEITVEEAIEEISKNEAVLDKLYADAGVERKYRPFRFPYGNRGGANAAALQEYFRTNGFDKLKDTQIPYAFWKEQGLDRNIDTLWTFDFAPASPWMMSGLASTTKPRRRARRSLLIPAATFCFCTHTMRPTRWCRGTIGCSSITCSKTASCSTRRSLCGCEDEQEWC